MSDSGISGTLTDGSGIGTFTTSKVVKDFVVDVLKTGAAMVLATGITTVPDAARAPVVVAGAVIGAVISAGYRAILKWAQTP